MLTPAHLPTPEPPLTDKTARQLSTLIVKEADVLVKFGKTNGRIVLHVYVPGSNTKARTITSEHEWASHPANEVARKKRREDAPTEDELIVSHIVKNEDTR